MTARIGQREIGCPDIGCDYAYRPGLGFALSDEQWARIPENIRAQSPQGRYGFKYCGHCGLLWFSTPEPRRQVVGKLLIWDSGEYIPWSSSDWAADHRIKLEKRREQARRRRRR